MQIPALACVKLSFIYFYRRIFCTGISRTFHNITTAAIVLTIAWAVTFEVAFLFICKGKFSAWWISIKTLETYCHPQLKLELGFAGTDFITDLIVLVLPLPLASSTSVSGIGSHLLTLFSDMATSNVNQPKIGHYSGLLSRGIVSLIPRRRRYTSLIRSRTVAASITRLVIFVRAVENLKVEYKTSGANLRKYFWRQESTVLTIYLQLSQPQGSIGA